MAASAVPDDFLASAPADLVVPPREVRETIEGTAGYVARNGKAFEQRIRESGGRAAKFAFVQETDAYHAYYLWRVEECKAGRTATASQQAPTSTPSEDKPKQLEPPPAFEFAVRLPNISAMDLDIMRYTAAFVSINGHHWMTNLMQREMGNSQFDFLRPQHSLHQYFNQIVAQYKSIIESQMNPDLAHIKKKRLEEVERTRDDKYYLLEKARKRAEYNAQQQKQKQQAEEEAEKARVEYAQIDWADFTYVETIRFADADLDANLDAPVTLGALQSSTLEDLANMTLNAQRIEEAPPDYEESNGTQAAAPVPQDAPRQHQSLGYQESPEEQLMRERRANQEAQAAAAQAAARNTGPVKIRENYIPRAQQKKQSAGGPMAQCPNCKQMIPHADLGEHIRIEMLDPQWREAKQKMEARTGTTNLSTTDVAGNLKRLASHRGGVDAAEAERIKRQMLGPGVSAPTPPQGKGTLARVSRPANLVSAFSPFAPPAGSPVNGGPPTTNIQEQLANIRAKAGQNQSQGQR